MGDLRRKRKKIPASKLRAGEFVVEIDFDEDLGNFPSHKPGGGGKLIGVGESDGEKAGFHVLSGRKLPEEKRRGKPRKKQ